jgi:hypothetical protein
MKKLIMAGLLLGASNVVFAASLQDKFTQALTVVADATSSVTQKPLTNPKQDGGQSVGQSYQGNQAKQTIQANVDTEAQALLLEVADVVADLALKLIKGTKNPTEANRLEACRVVGEGMEKRRWAPFYEGYDDLHVEFKEYVNQFTTIGDILECR